MTIEAFKREERQIKQMEEEGDALWAQLEGIYGQRDALAAGNANLKEGEKVLSGLFFVVMTNFTLIPVCCFHAVDSISQPYTVAVPTGTNIALFGVPLFVVYGVPLSACLAASIPGIPAPGEHYQFSFWVYCRLIQCTDSVTFSALSAAREKNHHAAAVPVACTTSAATEPVQEPNELQEKMTTAVNSTAHAVAASSSDAKSSAAEKCCETSGQPDHGDCKVSTKGKDNDDGGGGENEMDGQESKDLDEAIPQSLPNLDLEKEQAASERRAVMGTAGAAAAAAAPGDCV